VGRFFKPSVLPGRFEKPSYKNAPLDASFLGGAAAVVRQRGDVLDRLDRQAGGLERGDRRLAAGAGALDAHFDLLEAELRGPLGRRLRRALGGERRALAAALEADRPGRGE